MCEVTFFIHEESRFQGKARETHRRSREKEKEIPALERSCAHGPRVFCSPDSRIPPFAPVGRPSILRTAQGGARIEPRSRRIQVYLPAPHQKQVERGYVYRARENSGRARRGYALCV